MALLLVAPACDRATSPPPTTAATSTTTRRASVTGALGEPLAFAGLELVVVGPAPAEGGAIAPDPRTAYVRYTVRVRNLGPAARSFTPLQQAVLLLPGGERRRPEAGLFPGDITGVDVAPGGSSEGTVSFVVPDGAVPQQLVFTDEAGVTTTVELV